jgi:hypothetical protein
MRAYGTTALGALCGLAWACGLRGFMTQVTTGRSSVSWNGTFLWVLVPGIAVGALLGFAEHIRRTTGNPRGRWLVWSPFAFAGVVVADLILHGSALRGGMGGGALALPVFAVVGAYAIAGRRTWARITCGLVALAPIPIWALAATQFGARSLGLTEARGAWVALYFWSYLALLMVATAIPLRIPPAQGPRWEARTHGGIRVGASDTLAG